MFNPNILAAVQAATCAIVVRPPDAHSEMAIKNVAILGTGFLIAPRTIVTAGHVATELTKQGVTDDRRLAAFAPPGSLGFEMVGTTLVGIISRSKTDAFDIGHSADIAMFRLESAPPVPVLKPSDESDLMIGRPVGVCSYPSGNRLLFSGSEIERAGPTFQFGFVSGTSPTNFIPGDKVSGFLASYLTAPTMSGAPVFTENGKVLGIHWGGHKPYVPLEKESGMIGYCVPFMYTRFMNLFASASELFMHATDGEQPK